MYLTQNQYTYNTDATHSDDGVVIGVPVPLTDPDVHGAYSLSTGEKPYTVGVTSDPNHLKLSSKNTPAAANMYKVTLFGDTFLKVRTNFTLNSGDITSVICSFKDDTKSWNVKWTGVPVIDQFVCASGKKFYSVAVDMLISCPTSEQANFYFDWDINFTTPFTYIWNFVTTTVIEMANAPYINLSMVPWITTYTEKQAYDRKHKVNRRDLQYVSSVNSSEPHMQDVNQNLYPILPTAPELPSKPYDDFKPNTSLFKRMFGKRKTHVQS